MSVLTKKDGEWKNVASGKEVYAVTRQLDWDNTSAPMSDYIVLNNTAAYTYTAPADGMLYFSILTNVNEGLRFHINDTYFGLFGSNSAKQGYLIVPLEVKKYDTLKVIGIGTINPDTTFVPYRTDTTSEVLVNNITAEVQKKIRDVYSTEETVVGTWIDGKPIYRKCYDFKGNTSVSTSGTIVDSALTTAYVDNLINFSGSCFNISNKEQFQNGSILGAKITSTGLVIIAEDVNRPMKNFYVEYTKTTD